jgi:hypothetical protein
VQEDNISQLKEQYNLLIQQNALLMDMLSTMQKQLNDLHTIVMSKPVARQKKQIEKKTTKKEKLAEILAKRAFGNTTKSS